MLERQAEGELDPDVLALGDFPDDDIVRLRVAELRAAGAAVFEVEQRDIVVLPWALLIELDRDHIAFFADQVDPRHVKPQFRVGRGARPGKVAYRRRGRSASGLRIRRVALELAL